MGDMQRVNLQGRPEPKPEPVPFQIPEGTKPKSDLEEGQRYPAFMRFDSATVESMKFGPTVKIPYDIWFRDSQGEWSMVTFTELASLSWSLGGRLVKRLQSLNNNTITEETDLAHVIQRGWVDLLLHRKDTGYLGIDKVYVHDTRVETPDTQTMLSRMDVDEIPF